MNYIAVGDKLLNLSFIPIIKKESRTQLDKNYAPITKYCISLTDRKSYVEDVTFENEADRDNAFEKIKGSVKPIQIY